MTFDNSDTTHIFVLKAAEFYSNSFQNIAMLGDSIIKPRHGYELTLKAKQEKAPVYTIKEWDAYAYRDPMPVAHKDDIPRCRIVRK